MNRINFEDVEAIFYILLILAFGLWIHSAEAEVPIVTSSTMPPAAITVATTAPEGITTGYVASTPIRVATETSKTGVTTRKGYIGDKPVNTKSTTKNGTVTTTGWIDGHYINITTKKD